MYHYIVVIFFSSSFRSIVFVATNALAVHPTHYYILLTFYIYYNRHSNFSCSESKGTTKNAGVEEKFLLRFERTDTWI